MLLGVPCAASRTGGIPDMAEDQRSALLFEKGNVHELARCVLRIFENDGLADSLSREAAKQAGRNHDGDENYAVLMGIYRDMINRGSVHEN